MAHGGNIMVMGSVTLENLSNSVIDVQFSDDDDDVCTTLEVNDIPYYTAWSVENFTFREHATNSRININANQCTAEPWIVGNKRLEFRFVTIPGGTLLLIFEPSVLDLQQLCFLQLTSMIIKTKVNLSSIKIIPYAFRKQLKRMVLMWKILGPINNYELNYHVYPAFQSKFLNNVMIQPDNLESESESDFPDYVQDYMRDY